MKASKLIAFSVGVGSCIALYACGGSGHSDVASGGGTTSQPQTLVLSVDGILKTAQTPSETADPVSIEGLTVTPSDDETSDPVAVE